MLIILKTSLTARSNHMDIKYVPKKYRKMLKEMTNGIAYGQYIADMIDQCLSDADDWNGFQSMLSNEFDSYRNDFSKIEKILK
jgi:hypothetical protein